MKHLKPEDVKVGSIWEFDTPRGGSSRIMVELIDGFEIHYKYIEVNEYDESIGYRNGAQSSDDIIVFECYFRPIYTVEGFEV